MKGFSKSLTIQSIQAAIESNHQMIESFKGAFNADEYHPYVAKLRARIVEDSERLNAARKLVVDNSSVFE